MGVISIELKLMKKFLILLLFVFLACGPSEEEIQSQIDEAVNQALEQATTLPQTSTTSSTITTTTIYGEIDVCLQYLKEVADVYVEHQLTVFPMKDTVDDWYESDMSSFESAGAARTLNIVRNNSLTRLNAKVKNLIPDSKNSLNYSKWLQLTENTNKSMELLIYGFENSDYDFIQQGNSLITVVNRDFGLLPDLYNCGE